MTRKKPDTDTLSVLHEHGIHVASRTCFLHGDIDTESATEFIKNFTYLTAASSDSVHIDLMSAGGDVDAGMAVYDTVASAVAAGVAVNAKVRGEASSIACVILQACSARYILPNATIMHHRGTAGGGSDASPDEKESVATYTRYQYDRIDAIVYNRVKDKYGKSWKKFREDTARAMCMTAAEAVEMGFADYVV